MLLNCDRLRFAHNSSVEQVNHPLRMFPIPRVVRDHANRRAGLMQLAGKFHHRFTAARIQVACRLVGEED